MIRFVTNVINLNKAIKKSFRNSEFRLLSILVAVCLMIGTVFYRIVEGWSWLDCVYFSVVTLTTVGYGDLNPTTAISKIFTMFYILIGLGLFLVFVDTLSRRLFSVNIDKPIPKD
ncbi:hypothetical protein CL656_05940 [bacterium]|nr:hypothetical protein [bacterium]